MRGMFVVVHIVAVWGFFIPRHIVPETKNCAKKIPEDDPPPALFLSSPQNSQEAPHAHLPSL